MSFSNLKGNLERKFDKILSYTKCEPSDKSITDTDAFQFSFEFNK